jgi:hypothetical protein
MKNYVGKTNDGKKRKKFKNIMYTMHTTLLFHDKRN